MYKSPIETIVGEMQMDFDGEIYKVVQKYDINVDREELIKALRYDRNQYDKGYRDGCTDAIERFVEKILETICQENELYQSCAKNILPIDYQRGYEDRNDDIVHLIKSIAKEIIEDGEQE